MRKEELRKLKRINATPKMVRMAKENHRQMIYGSEHYQIKKDTVYDVMIRCQTRGKYLMVCIFFPKKIEQGELTPTYEIYCNPEGNEYITRVLEKGKEVKWSDAMVHNVGNMYHYMFSWNARDYCRKRIWQSWEGMKSIQQFLKTKKDGIWGLDEWQQSTRDKRIAEAEAREKAPWDKDMKLIPKIVPSFEAWMKKEAAREYFMFYEYSKKGAEKGYCSHCGRWVPIEKPKHNKTGICSHCKKSVTFKVTSKIQTLETGEYKGQIIQRIKGGIVIRTFKQRQWYRNVGFQTPKSYMSEMERVLIFDDGKVKAYCWGKYKNKETRWIINEDFSQYQGYGRYSSIKLYKKNLSSLKKTVLSKSTIDMWNTLPTDVEHYLTLEKVFPEVEMLVRIGMFNLAKDLIKRYNSDLLNNEETELVKRLKIDKARLKRLKAIDGNITHLKWYQYEKIANRIWPDEMIKDFGNWNFTVSSFGFLNPPLSYVKIWNYLKKQTALSGDLMPQVRRTWEDYLNMAEKAKMDIKNEMIWKPKDLKAEHAKVLLILQSKDLEKEAKELEKKWPKVNEVVPKLKKFEYSDGKYCIVSPENIMDIVKEGTILRHCVHTCDFYFDRIQRDETYLFFLRHAEHVDVPWYTLEVEPNGNIRQKRTTGDNQNKDFEEAVKFLKKWQKEFIKRMTEEERKLGKMADEARKKEYEKLRKDGNRVWHGKLAGQLLADVLEQDFMAAVI